MFSVRRSLLVAAFAASSLVALVPAAASANVVGTLDENATSPARLTRDGAGNAYIGWTHDAPIDEPKFCKVPPGGTCTAPVTLPIPGATSSIDEVTQVFPSVGSGSNVYAVAPRYALNDVVVWTSTNGGASFGPGLIHDDAYSNKTDPTDILFNGGGWFIGGFNSGIGFSFSPLAAGPGSGLSSFPNPTGIVGSSSLAFDETMAPVIAYWDLSDPLYNMYVYSWKGSGSTVDPKNWNDPAFIGNGYGTKLAEGTSGLYLASQDYGGGASSPDTLNLRKYTGSSFGPPVTLANNVKNGLYENGDVTQSPGGRVSVVWPLTRAGDDALVLRLFTISDGGATSTQRDVAALTSSYSFGDHTEVALGDDGNGWVTFSEGSAIRLADLNPIAGPAVPKPPDYKGKTKIADKKKVGNFDLTLRLPKQCVQSQQRFFAGVGARKRKALSKKLGGKIKLKSVVFIYDGKKLKVKKKKPFRLLIDPGVMAAGSTHVVKTKVTAVLTKGGKEKKVKRTLKGAIKSC